MARTSSALLEIRNVSKQFPGVRALDDVSLTIHSGEVVALLGENGAGKSTLVKILSGAYHRDSGSIRVDGRELPIHYDPLDARALGIAIIYQELSLLPDLTVAENIFLTKEPLKSKTLGMIDYRRMHTAAQNILAELQADYIPSTAKVHRLSMPEKQMVEIAKALTVNCRVIIMDEPTTTLTWEETQRLFRMIKALKEQHVTIIYISHRLDEVFEIADRAVVLRDGKVVGDVSISETSLPQIIALMTGKEMVQNEVEPHQQFQNGEKELLRIDNFSDDKLIKNVSFTLYENEILGIAGLVGAGRTELARMIFGADKKSTGTVYISGQQVEITSPSEALHKGIGYLSENRKEEGLNLGLELEHNIVITDLASVSNYGVVSRKACRTAANSFINRLNIRGKLGTFAANLSGGNQQKVVISKWLHAGCKVLIFDEPTRGIDVGAKSEVHAIIRDFASGGRGAIVISSEVEELVGLCDRVLVMAKGQIVQTLVGQSINKDTIMQYVNISH